MKNRSEKIAVSISIAALILLGRTATVASGTGEISSRAATVASRAAARIPGPAPATTGAAARIPGPPPAATGGTVDSIVAALPARLDAWVKEKGLASLSVAVVKHHDIIYSQAFGLADIGRGTPATRETMYPIASVTKVFTAAVLAQLCERGIVNLEEPVTKYVPEYRVKSPFPGIGTATLRQLASHTSGLPKDAPVNFWCNYSYFGWIVTGGKTEVSPFVPTDELLKSLSSIELEHTPHIYSHYSNLGMQLLGIAVERACGRPFTEYIRSEIMKPLGMNHSGFMSHDSAGTVTATGYASFGPGVPLLPTPDWEPGCAIYSGGLYATADDLARFVSSQFPGAPAGGGRILSEGFTRVMRSPNSIRVPGRSDSYGLGWAVVRIEGFVAIEHNGELLGHTAHASAIPELGIGIVALANTKHYYWSPGSCKDLARDIYRDLVNAIVIRGSDEPFKPADIDLGRYAGDYALPGGFAHMTIKVDGRRLIASIVEDVEFNEPFIPVAAHEFCFEEDPGRTPLLLFGTDEAGRIDRVTFLSYTFIRRDT